jgi:hypothetical protein
MWQIHPNARTTPVVRAEISGSEEATGILAQRFGVSTETMCNQINTVTGEICAAAAARTE